MKYYKVYEVVSKFPSLKQAYQKIDGFLISRNLRYEKVFYHFENNRFYMNFIEKMIKKAPVLRDLIELSEQPVSGGTLGEKLVLSNYSLLKLPSPFESFLSIPGNIEEKSDSQKYVPIILNQMSSDTRGADFELTLFNFRFKSCTEISVHFMQIPVFRNWRKVFLIFQLTETLVNDDLAEFIALMCEVFEGKVIESTPSSAIICTEEERNVIIKNSEKPKKKYDALREIKDKSYPSTLNSKMNIENRPKFSIKKELNNKSFLSGYKYDYYSNHFYYLHKYDALNNRIQVDIDDAPICRRVGIGIAYKGVGFEYQLGFSNSELKNQEDLHEYFTKIQSLLPMIEEEFLQIGKEYPPNPAWLKL